MNGTPRPRPGGFPATPQTGGQQDARGVPRTPLPTAPTFGAKAQDQNAPFIPFDIIDPASQRLYVVTIYIALWAWRIYDFLNLVRDDTESLWQFMKWICIDGIFLFGLPALRIPWLEWSGSAMTLIYLAHAVLDGMLMFKIGLPVTAWLGGIGRMVYDRELAISERRVKPDELVHNASLILGKQIIHILPEGSATFNPSGQSFCLGGVHHHIQIPLQINQTMPKTIELDRIDLDTMETEAITLSSSTIKKMKKEAQRQDRSHQDSDPLLLQYQVKKTGMYVLRKVIDETNLEVQTRRSDVLVVPCPQASVKIDEQNKCKGDLSEAALEVIGTPPLKVKYKKLVNNEEREASFQSIQPEDFTSPLAKEQTWDTLVKHDDNNVAWARAQKISIPLSESLTKSGLWMYSIDEVQDALGNIINYRSEDGLLSGDLQKAFTVHERPKVNLDGCDSQRPLRAAKGDKTQFPLRFSSSAGSPLKDAPHIVEYTFTPEDELQPGNEHKTNPQIINERLRNTRHKPSIGRAGLYSIKSISTEFCPGEVIEPATCLLINPPEPALSITSEEVKGKCAGNPVGLNVALNLIGTPPFQVSYKMERRGSKEVVIQKRQVNGLRGQIELVPQEAGHYTYTFTEISDAIYNSHSLKDGHLVLEQDVKPSASAHFIGAMPKTACIDEGVNLRAHLQGDGPWSLQYELVHKGKRSSHVIDSIENHEITIETDKLASGGEYSLNLVSITDVHRCQEFLNEEAKFTVRQQRPKASFGLVDGKRSIHSLAGKKLDLPLRLTGEAPWTLEYAGPDGQHIVHLRNPNDRLQISQQGNYVLDKVNDKSCPGSVDKDAKEFAVTWIPKPSMSVVQSPVMEAGARSNTWIKNAVCEGEEDTFDITFSGRLLHSLGAHLQGKLVNVRIGLSPFDVKY